MTEFVLGFSVPIGATAEGSGSLALLSLYVGLAIGVSFLCSVMEAVLLSVTPAYVGALAEKKPAAAARLKVLKTDVDRPLAAILSLNTVAHTVGAAGAGAEAAAYFGDAAIGVFSAALTLGILVLSEIIPKTLGAVYWRGLAPVVARALKPLIWMTYPLVLLSQGLTAILARGRKEGSVSREELAAMAQIGHEEGVFGAGENRILASLLRFNGLSVESVMTPRTVVLAYDKSTTARKLADDGQPFSRVPVFGRNRDDITGYVLRDDVLKVVADGHPEMPLGDLAREVLSVDSALPLPQALELLLERREHIALVRDEYGGTAGIITIEDVIETLLDMEIVDETDHDHDMQAAARDRWKKRRAKLEGIATPGQSASEAERSAVIASGLTGGEPPKK